MGPRGDVEGRLAVRSAVSAIVVTCGSLRLVSFAPLRDARRVALGYCPADGRTPRSTEEMAMARWDTIQVEGQPMRVYLDVPAGGGAAPGVVVIMHGPGLDRFVEDRVEDLARHGYAAAAPDLYHRQPPDGDMMTRVGRLRDKEILADVDAAAAHLKRVARRPCRGPRRPRLLHGRSYHVHAGRRATIRLASRRSVLWRQHHEGVGRRSDAVRPHRPDRLPGDRFLRPATTPTPRRTT